MSGVEIELNALGNINLLDNGITTINVCFDDTQLINGNFEHMKSSENVAFESFEQKCLKLTIP
ncbi:hypothetical protein CHUAL_001523 [Chamberlinius hualienensis]